MSNPSPSGQARCEQAQGNVTADFYQAREGREKNTALHRRARFRADSDNSGFAKCVPFHKSLAGHNSIFGIPQKIFNIYFARIFWHTQIYYRTNKS
jgi:hypothetical protein